MATISKDPSETAVTVDTPPIPPSQDTGFFGHPRGLSTLFFTEMWERFSYYGLRPLLVLFMTAALASGGFGFERSQASAIVGIYAASVYLASLPGGWIADRILGLRRAIMTGAVLITLGHLSIGLSAFAHGKVPFFLGLILIVCGTGLLKPNISAIVGDLYPEGGARRDAGFSVFYMGINTGAFAGQLVAGALGENVGWHWGFGCAGVGMLIGLITFAVRQRGTLGNLGLEPSKNSDPVIQAQQLSRAKMILGVAVAILAAIVIAAATGVLPINPVWVAEKMTYVLVGLAVLFFGGVLVTGNLNGDEKKRLLVIFVLFIFSAIFWGAFEQAPTSLNLFARDFTDRSFFGHQIPSTAFQSVNSAFIIIFAPIFAGVWLTMAKRGAELSSPGKFALGLIFAGIGFGLMIPAAYMILNSGGAIKVSPWWLVFSYLFQTFGELCVSPVGLSSMTKLSPRKYVGQMMGIWFLATSVGNLIAGLVGGSIDPEKLEQTPQLFIWTTVALVGSAAVLALLAIPIRNMMKNVPVSGRAV